MSNVPPWLKKKTTQNPFKVGNNSRTNSSNYKLYNSYKWRQYSRKYRRANVKCSQCSRLIVNPQCKEHGSVVDHIIPINQGGAIWDERNHQTLCKHPCHDKKSGKDQKKYDGLFAILPNNKKIPI